MGQGMNDEFCLENLRIDQRPIAEKRITPKCVRKRKRGEFLKGPIPLAWLNQAGALPGKSLAVGMALWFLVGLKRTKMDLKLRTAVLNRFGINRKVKTRALTALEGAGLISVSRQPGKNPLVSILEVQNTGAESTENAL